MFYPRSPINFFHYFLKRESNQFFTSIAIRALGLGMVMIFEPIYLYFYFGQSLALTLIFFGAAHGLYALLAVWGGKIMARIGYDRAIFFSHFFFFGYFLCLFFIYSSFILIPLAIVLSALGKTFFWPSFHTDFARFSDGDHRGAIIGKKKIALLVPTIVSPVIGGLILARFGYPVLFTVVLVILLASAIPLFLTREKREVYTDTYQKTWKRIFKKENLRTSLSLASASIEVGINGYLWPLFMAVLLIHYTAMGGITSFSLLAAALFALYVGKLSDTVNRFKLLKVSSFLTAITWIGKYFVFNPLTAFLAQNFYRMSRITADVSFQAFFFEKASLKKGELDEFIVYREIIINIAKFFFLVILAGILAVVPKVNLSFLIAAIASLGLVFMGRRPHFRIKKLKT